MELRHLRYFKAVADCKGYREASRRLHIAQAALSQTIRDLERELEVELFKRARRVPTLTTGGEAFYRYAALTLAQADEAISAARHAARADTGSLSVGYLGSATYAFLPKLVQDFRPLFPGVKLSLHELSPSQQEAALRCGAIDLGFTRHPTSEFARVCCLKVLYSDSLIVAMPASRRVVTRAVPVSSLAHESLILIDREVGPGLFDTILSMCNAAGFSARIGGQPRLMQTALCLVAAEEGVAVIPSCVKNLASEGVRFHRLAPEGNRVDLVMTWKRDNPSILVRAFVEHVERSLAYIQQRGGMHVEQT